MAIRKLKPTTPGQRHKVIGAFDNITASAPEKSLVVGKKKSGGRNNTGKMTMRYIGGGRVFGPTPRDYGFKLNKKVKALARRSALTYKAQKQEIVVVENFELAAPKTKDFVALSKALQVADKKALFVVEALSDNLVLSSRNLRTARVMNAFQLNTYSVLDCKKLILTEAAVAVINEQFKA